MGKGMEGTGYTGNSIVVSPNTDYITLNPEPVPTPLAAGYDPNKKARHNSSMSILHNLTLSGKYVYTTSRVITRLLRSSRLILETPGSMAGSRGHIID